MIITVSTIKPHTNMYIHVLFNKEHLNLT